MKRNNLLLGLFLSIATSLGATAEVHTDYLVKFRAGTANSAQILRMHSSADSKITQLKMNGWSRIQMSPSGLAQFRMAALLNSGAVEYIQPNYKIQLLENPSLKTAMASDRGRAVLADCPIPIPGLCEILDGLFPGEGGGDNPDFIAPGQGGSGADPDFAKQWGMNDIGMVNAWQMSRGTDQIVVAVIDTGIDYTHPDLIDNLWQNRGETGTDGNGQDRATNGVDDDGNGYIDDVLGWDFVQKDNKPFDLKGNMLAGGNPGHGTHVAGCVAARGENGIGISGVAPMAKIMGLRFIGDAGQGSTADAIEAVKYSVDNGAQVSNNSWGSSGEDPNDPTGNQALRDVITYAQDRGALFIAAAGNGGQDGRGDNNDTARDASFPASYDHENIISVAAMDAQDNLGAFSNFGSRTVDIGAPGVKVYSTIVGGKYSDTASALLGATWDGTSMASPHIAGAAALYWSTYPHKNWMEVKQAILGSAKPVSATQGKMTSNGKLNVEKLLTFQ